MPATGFKGFSYPSSVRGCWDRAALARASTPRDMALGFSIPLDFSVVTPASLEEAYWLRDDGVDRLLGTTPLFHDGWIAAAVVLMIFSISMENPFGHNSRENSKL